MNLQMILNFFSQHGEVAVAFASAAVSVFAALLAGRETSRQRKLQTERLRQSLDQASLEWGNLAIDALGRAAMFARNRALYTTSAAFVTNKVNLLVALSVLVDRGRMFFPNIDPAAKGAHKEGAYRGHRPPVLDALMFAYMELENMAFENAPADDDSGAFIDECRRLLVSELQAHLDPRRKDEIIGRYHDQTHENRSGAIARAGELKALLLQRRPGIDTERARSGTGEKGDA